MNESNKYESLIDKECIICFENTSIIDSHAKCKQCNHIFHFKCWKQWDNKCKQNNNYSSCPHCISYKHVTVIKKYKLFCFYC